MSVMEFSTPKGRAKLTWPDELTSEERIKVLEDLLGFEKSHKKPLDFGDLRWKRADEPGKATQ